MARGVGWGVAGNAGPLGLTPGLTTGTPPGRRLSNVANPSAAVLLADVVFPNWPAGIFPHDGINCGYVDGHAEWVGTPNYFAQVTPGGGDNIYAKFWTTGWH